MRAIQALLLLLAVVGLALADPAAETGDMDLFPGAVFEGIAWRGDEAVRILYRPSNTENGKFANHIWHSCPSESPPPPAPKSPPPKNAKSPKKAKGSKGSSNAKGTSGARGAKGSKEKGSKDKGPKGKGPKGSKGGKGSKRSKGAGE
ncbi:hypothetical protein GQ607_016508 [Colletotrichum asianum]|uniref:Uncharacterized protein n=1 Tax=Colletotrichum asianum TaxID=702518 RepID=A0A8H3W0W5_9PEZI|nr:hypothetical protein GQ607_016508 [Colletotrichum asianum]